MFARLGASITSADTDLIASAVGVGLGRPGDHADAGAGPRPGGGPAPYRSARRRHTAAGPAMPADVARRVVAADLAVAYGPGWQQRLVAFDDPPAAAASIGQVHRGRWRDDAGRIVDVAV